MTLPAFHAALNGFVRAHGGGEAGPNVSAKEFSLVLAGEMAVGRAKTFQYAPDVLRIM